MISSDAPPTRGRDVQAFILDCESAVRTRCNLKGIGAKVIIGKGEVDANCEVPWVSSTSPTHGVDASAHFDCVIQRCLQSIRDKVESVQEVAFARSITTDQHGQRTQRNIAGSDASEVSDDQFTDERCDGLGAHAGRHSMPGACLSRLYANFAIASSICSGVGITGSTIGPRNQSYSFLISFETRRYDSSSWLSKTWSKLKSMRIRASLQKTSARSTAFWWPC